MSKKQERKLKKLLSQALLYVEIDAGIHQMMRTKNSPSELLVKKIKKVQKNLRNQAVQGF